MTSDWAGNETAWFYRLIITTFIRQSGNNHTWLFRFLSPIERCDRVFRQGRALAVGAGVKLANHELTVLVTGGDGDGFGIGGIHFVHSMRRNVDLLYIVMDNQI